MPPAAAPTDRRARRRQETIEEILRLAVDVMAEEGVGGLSLAAVARRLGVQPPALYKYFPSLSAIYDALFRRGQQEHLGVVAAAMDAAPAGMAAVRAGMDAAGRWSVANGPLAQLLFWRPIAGFEPQPDAFAPSVEMVARFAAALDDAAAQGEIGPAGASDDGVRLIGVLLTGALSQHMANEPHLSFEDGVFTSMLPQLADVFVRAYPPA
ncbi:TetR/AcrR family transcriptional regulator [Pseudonocardia sp. CA-107938]|uniref:TetR/AcrR family transcriptional regulator n=1 Tax=Pseudonocardia sp. CA-107938 TaxID=3240021 RepID=UPI003D91E7F8